MCEDLHGPWGDAATPVAGRAAATGAAVAGLSDAAIFPYDRAAVAANGMAVTCEQWPSTPVVPFLAGQDLLAVPVLLAGDHDLPLRCCGSAGGRPRSTGPPRRHSRLRPLDPVRRQRFGGSRSRHGFPDWSMSEGCARFRQRAAQPRHGESSSATP
jgi:hypothetical protein